MEIIIDLDVSRLALLPIGYLLEQEDPFDEFCEERGIPEAYRDIFVASAWAYQLYIYLDLIQERYGQDIADEVREQQCRVFEKLATAGSAIELALDLIEGAAGLGKLVVPLQYCEFDIPLEMNISMALLLGLPESPDFVRSPGDRAVQITRMDPEVDWCLTECLMSRRQNIVSSFSVAMAQIAEYPNSFSPVPSSGTA